MKKYFLFAAVAGMLASCSSESLTGSDPKIEPTTQEDLVPIEIGVATNQQKAITRGTGTVGDTDQNLAKNIWKGEKVKVLMYEIDASGNPTFNFTKDRAGNNLYDNTTYLITPLAGEALSSGTAKEYDATNSTADPYSMTGTGTTFYKVKYYPATGRSDFWGFYLGGSAIAASPVDDTPGTVTLNDITATCDGGTATTPAKSVDFSIDGAQDLMVAKAATGASDATTSANIVGNVPFTAGQEAAVGSTTSAIYASSYSAKSARGSLQPDLVFKHALTRLTFKVKAGNANAVGVIIKAIKVHSMTDGELIVAYNYKNGNISAANSIIWDDTQYDPANDYTTDTDGDGLYNYQDADVYPALSLKERNGSGAMIPLTPYTLTLTDVTNPAAIGEALLVAPQEKYWIEVEYDATTVTNMDWWDDSDGATSTDTYPSITKDLDRLNPADAFEAGNSYNVTITLYGPEKIEITTTLEPWADVDEAITVVGE